MMKNLENDDRGINKIKLELHVKYIIVISLILLSMTIIGATVTNNNFVNEVSFAATISSIILSVVAILMTLIGELKSENTKDKFLAISDTLSSVTDKIDKSADNLKGLSEINEKITSIEKIICRIENIDKIVGETNLSVNSMVAATLAIDNTSKVVSNSIDYIELLKGIMTFFKKQNNDTSNKCILFMIYYIIVYSKKIAKGVPKEHIKVDLKTIDKFDDSILDFSWGLFFSFIGSKWSEDNQFTKYVCTIMNQDYNEFRIAIDNVVSQRLIK